LFLSKQCSFPLNGGFYVEPQAGYTQTKIKNDEGAGFFTYAGNVGYLIGRVVDVAVRYESVSRTGGNLNFVGLRVAYNLPLQKLNNIHRITESKNL
jgi:hypothetical protein